MQHFRWTKAQATFLPEVDAEHRNLFRMAEELQQAVLVDPNGPEVGRVQELFAALAGSAEEHFAHEERMMQAARCESFAWHKQQHDTARRKMAAAAGRVQAGDLDAASALIGFLGPWLKDHLSLTDRMMAAQVRNADRLHAVAR